MRREDVDKMLELVSDEHLAGAAPQPGNGVPWPPAWPSARAWVL